MDTNQQSAAQESAGEARPHSVRLALGMLWLALLLYAVMAISQVLPGSGGAASWLVPVVTIAIVAVLVQFIERGSAPARLVYTVLFVLGSVPLALDPAAWLTRSPLLGGANVLMFALQLVAVIVLYSKKAAGFFGPRKPAAS